MTANNFIAAFETLADAPDGVERLREVILSLAVRGMLVEQRAPEQPAAQAIAELARARRCSLTVLRPNPEDQEWLFELPTAWCWTTVGALGAEGERSISDGPFGSKLKSEHYVTGDGCRVVRLGNIGRGDFRNDDRSLISQDYFEQLQPYHLTLGDLIVASLGDPPGRACEVPEYALPAINKADCFRVRPGHQVVGRYLVVVLNSNLGVSRSLALHRGDTRGRINLSHLRSMPVPLPPLAEQHRIVARVDELMGLLTRLDTARTARDDVRRAARDAALAALRDAEDTDAVEVAWGRIAGQMDALFAEPEDVGPLRQAVLGLAVRGRLVPTRPGVATSTGPFPIPTGWAWKTLLDLTDMITSGSRNWNQFYSATGATFIRSQDIKYDRLEYDDRAYVTVPGGSEGTRTRVDQGDWLITITGANVGKCAFLSDHPGEAYVSQHVALMRPKNLDFGRFGHIWLTAEQGGRGVLLADSYGAKPGLNLHQLRSLPVPVPPMHEQHRIVAKVDGLMAICDALEARLTTARDLRAQFAAAAVHYLDV